MRPAPNPAIEKCRITDLSAQEKGTNCGAFVVKFGNIMLNVIASDAGGWDHVSVSLPHRIPYWAEMAYVKSLFFSDDEVVMQLHVGAKDHVNTHNNCLHLWRPQSEEERQQLVKFYGYEAAPEWLTPGPIPLPPKEMV